MIAHYAPSARPASQGMVGSGWDPGFRSSLAATCAKRCIYHPPCALPGSLDFILCTGMNQFQLFLPGVEGFLAEEVHQAPG